jgi:hypothetical protein
VLDSGRLPRLPIVRFRFICRARLDREPRVLGELGILERFAALVEDAPAGAANQPREPAIRAQTHIVPHLPARHLSSLWHVARRLRPAVSPLVPGPNPKGLSAPILGTVPDVED